MIKISTHIGAAITPFIDEISNLRIHAFREFPYLYSGDDIDYERKYTQDYAKNEKALLILVEHGDKIIGALTGLPLAASSPIVQDVQTLFQANKQDINKAYYLGELILDKDYRYGLDLIRKMYHPYEAQIKAWCYETIYMLTVKREENHPLKPKNYKSQNRLWERAKFYKTGITSQFHWPTIQADLSIKEMNNDMELWKKELK